MPPEAQETDKPAQKKSPRPDFQYERVKFIHSVPMGNAGELTFATTQEGNAGNGYGFDSISVIGMLVFCRRGQELYVVPITNTTGGPAIP